MRVSLPADSYRSPEQVVGFYQRLMERVQQLPGVASAGAARSLPLGSTIGDFGLTVEGYVPPPGTRRERRLADRHATAISTRWASVSFAAAAITPADTTRGHARRARQRGDGAAILARTRSRSAVACRSAAAADRVRGSPSSGSSAMCGTTASPIPSRKSSTFRTPSGTSRRESDSGNDARDQELVVSIRADVPRPRRDPCARSESAGR